MNDALLAALSRRFPLSEKPVGEFFACLVAPAAPMADLCAKRDKTTAYVCRLPEHGDPSTDVFKKALGAKKRPELFETVLFGHSSSAVSVTSRKR